MESARVLLRCVVPALLAGLLLAGCFVQSLHPLYDEGGKELANDPSLPGTWLVDQGVDDHSATLVITAGKDNLYDLKYTEDGKTTALRAALVQVGPQRYLDVWLDSLDQFSQITTAAEAHLLPAHSFWRIALQGDSVSLACLNYDRLKNSVATGQVTLDRVAIKDDPIVLAASPAQLREFLAKYGADPANFGEPLTFHRQK
ncbi:MAG TPA: hypothetical protein VE825_11065 [Terriglobales bacterium]|jgi:hypothetical protein|nr:hypothetical protein [Terriglobales bacterium]